MSSEQPRVLVADLNNFARYPTIPVGYLVAACRKAGMEVSVFSPLSVGLKGAEREPPERRWRLAMRKASYVLAASSRPWVRNLRARLAAWRLSQMNRKEGKLLGAFERQLQDAKPDVALVSTYLMYKGLATAMTEACRRRGVPVVLGGPYFAQAEVASEWIGIPGLSALVAGELDLQVAQLVRAVAEGRDLSAWPGVLVPGSAKTFRGEIAKPLRQLDDVAFPDYRDFPWERYPRRIVPIITARGCAWGACTFCSDVTSSSGRTFRSRSLPNVLEEIRHHHEVHGARMFVFTDLKLNSNVAMWRGILDKIQGVVPGCTWIGAVHVLHAADNGLSADDLRAAVAAGCVRLTTGLESGSQRILDRMQKGTRVEMVGRFLDDATTAGVSTRCTMITGYPGEEATDLQASRHFLSQHRHTIERVSVNRLAVIVGTRLHRIQASAPESLPGFERLGDLPNVAQVDHRIRNSTEPGYRRAMMELLEAAHEINRKALRERARAFEGVM